MMSRNEFIEKAIIIHGNKFDYSLVVDTIKRTDKVKIICPIHGVFEHCYTQHVVCKYGCNKCKYKTISSKRRDTKEKFISKAIEVHGNSYDYSNVVYKNARTHVEIRCNNCHKVILMTPDNHIRGECGCFNCFKSKGEKQVQKFLDIMNLKYKTQKTFNDCRDQEPLKFDFYLPQLNTCIEYDGELHYNESRRKTRKPFAYYEKHDSIKTKYCRDNGIKLIRIKYTDYKNIKSILEKELLTNQNSLLQLNKESVSLSIHS